ncbi:MAG TPA: hypothetical protein VGV67_02530, partial [Solirubrobacteraceae bacterium]|nr:hypothetical protein [Solirubrobacteraceae bacterium]
AIDLRVIRLRRRAPLEAWCGARGIHEALVCASGSVIVCGGKLRKTPAHEVTVPGGRPDLGRARVAPRI